MQEDTFGEEGPPVTKELIEQSYAAPGQKATLSAGILYQAPWKVPADGMGAHARAQIRALAATGMPLRISSFGSRVILNDELTPEMEQLAYLETISFEKTLIAIKQFIFNTPNQLKEVICPSGVRRDLGSAVQHIIGSTIVYTSWERDRVHPQYIEILKDVGRLWVPCHTNRDAFLLSGMPSEKVAVIPYPYDPSKHCIAAPRGSTKVPAGKRYYHIGKWEPRKNQHRLIGAFLIAHTPQDRASLFIKTSGFGIGWINYPTFEESLRFWLQEERVKANGWTSEHMDRLIRVVSDKLSDADIEQIHARNNIYVSSGLGEAWDIPAFEAKLAGNRLVTVGFGGSGEYRELDDVQLVYESEAVHPGYHWEPDARWAKVSVELLAEGLRQVKPPKERWVPRHYAFLYSQYSVGACMLKSIRELVRELGCEDDLLDAGGYG